MQKSPSKPDYDCAICQSARSAIVGMPTMPAVPEALVALGPGGDFVTYVRAGDLGSSSLRSALRVIRFWWRHRREIKRTQRALQARIAARIRADIYDSGATGPVPHLN